MYNYIQGCVTAFTANSITLDNNGVGYNIYVANPYSFEVGSNYKVFTYHLVNENEQALFGFKEEDEKELFLKLINVKGLGPRTAMPMFATGSVNGIIDAISRENIVYLTKFPKVGDKLARQIILDLKGKLATSVESTVGSSELVDVLESLGYKSADIKKILPHVDYTKTIEEQIKDALKLLLK